MTRSISIRACLALLTLTAALAGCGNTYSRADFTTAVIGKSEQEVKTQFGTPATVETPSPDRATWTYTRETFDLDNQNRIDSKTTVTFEGAAGSRHAVKVDFS